MTQVPSFRSIFQLMTAKMILKNFRGFKLMEPHCTGTLRMKCSSDLHPSRGFSDILRHDRRQAVSCFSSSMPTATDEMTLAANSYLLYIVLEIFAQTIAMKPF
jgi:hypothetical protein